MKQVNDGWTVLIRQLGVDKWPLHFLSTYRLDIGRFLYWHCHLVAPQLQLLIFFSNFYFPSDLLYFYGSNFQGICVYSAGGSYWQFLQISLALHFFLQLISTGPFAFTMAVKLWKWNEISHFRWFISWMNELPFLWLAIANERQIL